MTWMNQFRHDLQEIACYEALLEWWEEAKRVYTKGYHNRIIVEDADEIMREVFEETYHYVKVD